MKIELHDLIKVLNENVLENNTCVEMNFCIDDDIEYEDCWLGKTPDMNNENFDTFYHNFY